jgi:hypothetical protein
MQSAQESHPQSEHSQMKSMAKVETATATIAEKNNPQPGQSHDKTKVGIEARTRPDTEAGCPDGWKRSQALNMMPSVVVTGPQDSNPSRRSYAVHSQTEQSQRSSVQGKSPLPKEHYLVDCSTVQTVQEVDSRTCLPTHGLMNCTTVEDIQKQKLDLHELTNCNTITESSTAVQHHTLANCDNSTVSENQELSYVHDFTDCPIDKAILEYYEKQASVQSHSLAECSLGSSAGNARSESEVQQHNIADCVRSSKVSPNKVAGGNSHNLRDCSGRNSGSILLVNNPYLGHSLADCTSDGSLSSTVTSDKQYRSASGTVDSTSKNITHGGVQHRLSSCPTPIAMSGNHSSDDSQATQTPTDPSTSADQHNTDVSGGSRTSGTRPKIAEGPIHNRQRRRHKGKGKANENAAKTGGAESSRPAEHSAQHALQQLLLTADGEKENDENSAKLLKANVYAGPEGTVQSTLY